MKRFNILIAIIFILTLSSCYVQERYHVKSMFSASVKRRQFEKQWLKQIDSTNNNLHTRGAISDSVYTDVTQKTELYKKQGADYDEKIKQLQPFVEPRKSLKQRKKTAKQTIDVYKNVVVNAAVKDGLFQILEIKLIDTVFVEKGKLAGMLKDAAKQQEKEAAKISEISNAKEDLVNKGKVAPAISGPLDQRFENYKRRMDSISSEIKILTVRLNSKEDFEKNSAIIKRKILLIDTAVNQGASSREYVFNMIMESLANSTPNQFSFATFFGPGDYIIPEEKYNLASTYFSPLIDSLIIFSNKFESVHRIATIVVNGYADAVPIIKGSSLYKAISTYLNIENPSSKELNRGLSALRAEEMSRVLLLFIKQRAPEFKSVEKITFESIEAGYGEKLPSSKIKDYKIRDERRRIVIIFWNVLPVE